MVISEENIQYSLRNLRMRKFRSFLTILSIFVGISSIFIFISFGWGLFNYVESFTTESSADKLLIQAKGGTVPGLDNTFKLTDDDLKVIDGVAGVFETTGSSFTVAEIQKSKEKKFIFLASYDPKKPIIWELSNVKFYSGRELNSGETKKAILGYNYLKEDKIFSKALKLNDNIEIQGEKTRVVGFLEEIGNPQDDSNIYVTQEYFDELIPDRAGNYGWIIAKIDLEDILRITVDIERGLRKERNLERGKEDFFVQSFEELISSFSGALNIIIGFVILIAFISILVSAINTANTMITSVIERTKEIGVIKSIGAKNSEILKIFLFESSFLGLIAGVSGVSVGWGLTFIASRIIDGFGWGFLSPHYSPTLFIGLILFATFTGAISGVIPALNASKINAVDALRYE
jgi:putative ABC transport system permease protein